MDDSIAHSFDDTPRPLAMLPAAPLAVASLIPAAAAHTGWQAGTLQLADCGKVKVEFYAPEDRTRGAGALVLSGSARLGTRIDVISADRTDTGLAERIEPMLASVFLLARGRLPSPTVAEAPSLRW